MTDTIKIFCTTSISQSFIQFPLCLRRQVFASIQYSTDITYHSHETHRLPIQYIQHFIIGSPLDSIIGWTHNLKFRCPETREIHTHILITEPYCRFLSTLTIQLVQTRILYSHLHFISSVTLNSTGIYHLFGMSFLFHHLNHILSRT